ncbi:MAG TPA: threonine/homoserine exporter RhtA [Steroidobacteraceae bacterium]
MPISTRAANVLPIALLLLAMASFQAGASIAKTMFPIVGATAMVTVRILFGAVILCLTLRPWRVRITRASWRALVVYGVSLGVMNFLFYAALNRIPLGIAVALEFTGPLAVAVLASRRLVDFVWVLLACAGLSLLLPVANLRDAVDTLGMLYSLGAGACWALYIVYGQRAGAYYGSRTVALGTLISAIVIVPIGVLNAGSALFSRAIVLPGLAVAVLSTAIPYSLEMVALRRLPARTFGILMSLEPACGALFGLLFLNERLAAMQWTAIALVIAASIGTAATAGRKTLAPVPVAE